MVETFGGLITKKNKFNPAPILGVFTDNFPTQEGDRYINASDPTQIVIVGRSPELFPNSAKVKIIGEDIEIYREGNELLEHALRYAVIKSAEPNENDAAEYQIGQEWVYDGQYFKLIGKTDIETEIIGNYDPNINYSSTDTVFNDLNPDENLNQYNLMWMEITLPQSAIASRVEILFTKFNNSAPNPITVTFEIRQGLYPTSTILATGSKQFNLTGANQLEAIDFPEVNLPAGDYTLVLYSLDNSFRIYWSGTALPGRRIKTTVNGTNTTTTTNDLVFRLLNVEQKGSWLELKSGLETLSGSSYSYFLDANNGDDIVGDGSASKKWRSTDFALTFIAENYRFTSPTGRVTIQLFLAAGTYENTLNNIPIFEGTADVIVFYFGSFIDPTSVVLTPPASSNGKILEVNNPKIGVILFNLTLQGKSTNIQSNLVEASNSALVSILGTVFVSSGFNSGFYAEKEGKIIAVDNSSIIFDNFNCNELCYAEGGEVDFSGATVLSLPSGKTGIVNDLAIAGRNGTVVLPESAGSYQFNGTFTGRRFTIYPTGELYFGEDNTDPVAKDFLPGDEEGIIYPGGIYQYQLATESEALLPFTHWVNGIVPFAATTDTISWVDGKYREFNGDRNNPKWIERNIAAGNLTLTASQLATDGTLYIVASGGAINLVAENATEKLLADRIYLGELTVESQEIASINNYLIEASPTCLDALARGRVWNALGLYPLPVAGTLNLQLPQGYFGAVGRNFFTDSTDPHKLDSPAYNPLIWDLIAPNGSAIATNQTPLNFSQYWNGSTLVTVPGNNDAILLFLFWVAPTNKFYMVVGSELYNTIGVAENRWDAETIPSPPQIKENSLLLATILGRKDAVDSESDRVIIIPHKN